MTSVDRIQGLSGGIAIKVPCRVATTANITLSGEQTIDGVAVVDGDRVLVKNQTDGTENGIYEASTGGWTRAPDFDGANDVVEGTLVLVTSGTVGGDLGYQQTTASPIIGTSSLVFSVALSLAAVSTYITTLLDDADAAAARATLGLVIGTHVQAYDADTPTVAASQAEMEAGTEVVLRSMSPLRVAQAIDAQVGHGQCRLTLSAGNLKLSPYGGNKLIINGVSETVPDAGVTLAPTGLTAGFYYIYAYMNAGTMTLEASTTARATSTTTGNKGVEIKNGDNTRTLVGAAYSTAAAFSDSTSSRLVLSWFNRRNLSSRAWLTTGRTTTSTSIAEINSEARAYFLNWSDEAASAMACGSASNSSANQYTYMVVGWDGVAVLGGYAAGANATVSGPNSLAAFAAAPAGQLTEAALHYAVLGGAVTSGTGTYIGAADNGSRCEISAMWRG